MKLKLRPYMWAADGPEIAPANPTSVMVGADVDGLPPGESASIKSTRDGWQIRRNNGDWTGGYITAETALAAIEAAVIAA